jgi:preprotein translocase subunit SecD
VLASVALGVYIIVVLFIFKAIPITLTLAGVAGFILSIGMAVDANILIFERMKEELRLGKPKEVAVRLGFSRAWPSIRDSNISSIITTFILFYFGSGIIRGFAIALFIGIIVSMFSAILVTRNLLAFFEKDV